MIKRGFFGIGIYNGKTAANIGTLWRSAAILGADFIFTVGRRYHKQCSDTMKTPRHIPLYNYESWDDFFKHVPYDCPVVAVELDENAIPLKRITTVSGVFICLERKTEEYQKMFCSSARKPFSSSATIV